MGNLLIRRREMILPSSAPSEWDSEWSYTEGAPTVSGWVRMGSGNEAMTATGYRLRGYGYEKDISISNGVLETKFQIINERSNLSMPRVRLRIGNSNNAIVVAFSNIGSDNSINLVNYNSSWNDAYLLRYGTNLGTFALGGWYKVKMIINGSTGSVEINDAVVADNINTAGMYQKGTLLFGYSSNSYAGTVFEYVRYKSLD